MTAPAPSPTRRGASLRIGSVLATYYVAVPVTVIEAPGVRGPRLFTLGLTVAIFAPLGAIRTALVYRDLRKGREGATIEDLISVFDGREPGP